MATFSVTDIGTFKECRRKWDYSSNARQNLMKVGAGPEALELGGLIHRALADWIVICNNETKLPDKLKLSDLFKFHALSRQEEIKTKFEETTKLKIQDKQLESFYNIVMLGVAMMDNYQEFHKTPLPPDMRFASPEQEVLVEVPNTEHQCNACFNRWYTQNPLTANLGIVKDSSGFIKFEDCTECNGTGIQYHYMSMTLDGLVVDKRDWLWVLEHKTFTQRPTLVDLSMNEQFSKYTWGVSQLDVGRVRGVLYDGMKKKPKPTYVQENGVRRKENVEDLFLRKTLIKEPAELEVVGKQVELEIKEMANNPVIYPRVPWQGCVQSKCAFIDVCRMQMLGEDPTRLIGVNYTQREIVRGGNVQDEE